MDALWRSKPKHSAAAIRARAQKHLYWGVFLVALGILLIALRWPTAGIAFFVIPGLFCLASSLIPRT